MNHRCLGGAQRSRNNKVSSSSNGHQMADMSKSLASFHLSSAAGGGGAGGSNGTSSGAHGKNKALMDTSVDQLFKEGEVASAQLDVAVAAAAAKYPDKQQQQQPLTYTMDQATAGVGMNHPPANHPPRFLPVSTLEDVQAIR